MKKWDRLSWIILALWVIPVLVFMGVTAYVNATENFLSSLESGIVSMVCVCMITGAMVLKTVKNREKHPAYAFWIKIGILAVYFVSAVYTYLIARL